MKKIILVLFSLGISLSALAQLSPEFKLYYEIQSSGGFDEIHLWMENTTVTNQDFGAINLLVDFDDTQSTYVPYDPATPGAVNLWYDAFDLNGNAIEEQALPFVYTGRASEYNNSLYYQIFSLTGDLYTLGTTDIPKVIILRFQQAVAGVPGKYFIPDPYDRTLLTGNQFQQFTKTGFASGDYFFEILPSSPTSFPVEMLDFEAFQVGEATVELEWTTAWESNNAEFQVERSQDGTFFQQVGVVAGAGNTNKPTQYGFFDYEVPQGNLYYRLRQIDLDGTFTYSEVRQVTIDTGFDLNLGLYPNPAVEVLHVNAHAEAGRLFELRILDTQGKVLEQRLRVAFDQDQHTFQLGNYPEGNYLLECFETESGRTYAQPFIIEK